MLVFTSRDTICFVLLSLSIFSSGHFKTCWFSRTWNIQHNKWAQVKPIEERRYSKIYVGDNNTPFDHLTAHNKTILFCFCYLSQNCTKYSLPDKIANSKRKSCDVMVFHYSREESSSWVLEILQYKFSLVGRLCIQNLYWGLTKELKAFLHFSNLLL